MRTDRLFLTATALSGALLFGPPPLVAQDTLEARAEEVFRTAEVNRTSDRVVTGRDLHIGQGELVEGKVVLAGGDLLLEGHVTGDVTVTGGDLELGPAAVIDGSAHVTGGDLSNAGSIGGDVRVTGGRLINRDGRVAGEMRVEDAVASATAGGRERPGAAEAHIGTRGGWTSRVSSGLSGLASNVALGLLLAGLGAVLVFFAHPQLERVSDSVRRDTVRAGLLGVASHFLALPVFVLGIVLLVLTLIGIPLLLLFVPLFWVALIAVAGYGLVAVAHAVGERTAERSGHFEARYRNSYTYVFSGVGMLIAPLIAANLLKLTGFLHGVGSLLEGLAWMALWLAATVGVGAVLLTRGGMGPNWRWKRRSYDPIIDGDAFGGSNA